MIELVLEYRVDFEDPLGNGGGSSVLSVSRVCRSARRVVLSTPRLALAMRTAMLQRARRRAEDLGREWRPILPCQVRRP